LFTGLIREIAKVQSYNNNILSIKSKYRPKLGDSIAINGACLTVISTFNGGFSVELSLESRELLVIENYTGDVHIEPAMMMGDRFEGHVVQGHVDCIGFIKNIQKNENGIDFFISIPYEFMKYIIPKGSIAIDGVSLTINEVYGDNFRLTIIPHTIENTIFKRYKIGTKVNIETDMFARYVYNMFKKDDVALSWDRVDNMMFRY
jgi:riboflavin synthase